MFYLGLAIFRDPEIFSDQNHLSHFPSVKKGLQNEAEYFQILKLYENTMFSTPISLPLQTV